MVGELTGKMGALGLAGAAGYGLKQVAYGFREASRQAYNLDVSAKNAGMRVDDFTPTFRGNAYSWGRQRER
ncbi:Uncharacterised protein [Citrobacter freundii]|nr:Uncharacterised protein [Citrobacter freundii]